MIEVQDETETAKCVPINDEIESQDTELQEEERSLHSDEDSDEEEDDRSTTDQGSPPPVDKQNEIADEILAGFDNETADDKTTELNDDFLSELNDMTVKPDERDEIDGGDDEFMKELEDFDPN